MQHTRISHDVVIRIDEGVETLRASVGRLGRLQEIDANATILHLTVDSLGFLVMILDQLHAEFTIIQPPEVIDYLHNLGTFLTRNTAR
jgi:acyl carrier protein